MEVEIFETSIGVFKTVPQDKTENVVFVQTFLQHEGRGFWENVGFMKKKEFMKLIKPHNPQKKETNHNSEDNFWSGYSTT